MKKLILSFIVLLLYMGNIYAQVTTSSLTGTIKDSEESLIGATVKAIHQPTGTSYGASTGGDGRFSIANMRVGGPYSVQVSYIGYEPKKVDGIILNLGEPYVLNVMLKASGVALDEVVVTAADPNSILNANKSGATTTISRQQIQTLPSISRSVNDITRVTPQANGTSIGGGNYRSNNFTVDGSDFNNQFGIGSNIPANGSPISLDALEQISVNVTPYDVRQSGFVGGAVNAVTRSGSNNFFGTAFYVMRNDKHQGSKVGNFEPFPVQNFDQKQYGLSFGGPIVKDKLFFFVNTEFDDQIRPGQNRFAATPANPYDPANTNIARPAANQLDDIKNYLLSTYSYDPGIYQGYSFPSNNDKFLARLDWNISQNHRFNVRYNQVESKSPSFVSTSRSPLASFPNSRTSNFALHFNNSNYYQEANQYSAAAELNSSFGSKFSNILRGSYTNQNDPRSSDSGIFPFVDILDDGSPLTSFGYEPFSGGNLRDVKTYSIADNFNMALGKHNITLGAQADFSTIKNGFQRFATSYYTFASYSDFINGANPQDFAITYSLLPGYEQAFPSFKFAQYSAYLQDEFTISERFKLTAGLRVEQPTYPSVDEIRTHPLVAELSFNNGERINTGVLPKNRLMFSPRFGFNWDVIGNRQIQIRGGSGIFTGRVPFVWIVAQSGDAGLLQFTQTYVGQANTPGPFNPDPAAYRPASPPQAGTSIPSAISANSPDFKFPQTWKSSLAFDVKLPWGIVGTLEGIYNEDINAAIGRNANLVSPQPLNVSGYPDNRPFYPSSNTEKFVNPLNRNGLADPTGTGAFNVAVLDNEEGGYYWSASAQLTKQFGRGLSAFVAYTKSDARNFGDGGGDQLLNLWSIPQTYTNSNIPSLSYTSNVIPDRVIASLSYRKEYLKNLATSISVFYEGAIQNRFSYTYSSDFNRDGQTNDLIYVPNDPSEITFVPLTVNIGGQPRVYSPQEQSDIFFSYIAQDDYLSSRQGQYAERNGGKFPWRNQVDFRLVQEVFKNVGGKRNSIQFTWDVFNAGNLINKNWGAIKFVNNSSILVPQNVSALTNDGTTRPTFRMATANGDIVRSTFSDALNLSSTYYMQFGIRYNFQ